MYYILIVLGIALVIAGIVGLNKEKGRDADSADNTAENKPVASANTNKDSKDNSEKYDSHDRERYDDGLSDAERKGQAFELYVRDHFSHKDYSLVEHVNDKASHEHVTERSKYPDMVFRHRASDTKFAVECKYRTDWDYSSGIPQIEWAEEHNIENYLQFADEQKMDVVVVIGLGGTPESPAEVYAAPLYAIKKYTLARKKYLQQFKLADPKSNFRFILSKHTVEN